MQARLHHRAPAHGGRPAVGGDIDDHLQLRMIEQPAIARAIVPLGKRALKPLDIEPPHPGLAAIDAAEEPDFALVGKQVDDFVVLRFVDEIAVSVLHLADLFDVLLDRQLMFEPRDPRLERGHVRHWHPLFGPFVLAGLDNHTICYY